MFGEICQALRELLENSALCEEYSTKLMQLAKPRLESPHLAIRKEAKRQMAWLEKLDGKTYDMDSFRSGCALRIVSMLQLIQKWEGK